VRTTEKQACGGDYHDGDELPIPESTYAGGCPFAKWFKAGEPLPDGFGVWERNLLSKYEKAWEKAGSPRGVRMNDHNYNTVLGQGNTLAFVSAKLEIFETRGLPNTRFGLYAKPQTLPAVVRFSDFGADSSSFRLERMAVKVRLPTAWDQEANLLFTETVDAFPIPDYHGLGTFAGKSSLAGFESLIAGVLRVFGGSFSTFKNALSKEVLAKKYYSMLPYALGTQQAAKFQLIPRQYMCGEPGAVEGCCLPKNTGTGKPEQFAGDRAAVTANFLEKCDAVFDLQLQVKDAVKYHDVIQSHADQSWSEKPITVGKLTIPAQKCTKDWAVSTAMRDRVASHLGVEPEGVDKMFAFHTIMTHEDNKPLGDINAFRAAYYSQNTKSRYATIHHSVFNKTAGGSLPTVLTKFPFSVLDRDLLVI